MINGQARMPTIQFMKKKPVRWGLKVFTLAESASGYMWNAKLSEGKSGGERCTPSKVVLDLVQPYRGRGHIIFTDNFYTSVNLYTKLYADGCMYGWLSALYERIGNGCRVKLSAKRKNL